MTCTRSAAVAWAYRLGCGARRATREHTRVTPENARCLGRRRCRTRSPPLRSYEVGFSNTQMTFNELPGAWNTITVASSPASMDTTSTPFGRLGDQGPHTSIWTSVRPRTRITVAAAEARLNRG